MPNTDEIDANRSERRDIVRYAPIRIDCSPQSTVQNLTPSADSARPLFQTGVWRLGRNLWRGHFEGGTPCSKTHLLQAVISGTLRCERGERSWVVKPGELFIAPARGPHQITMVSPSCETVWAHLHQVPQWEFLVAVEDSVQPLNSPAELKHAFEYFFEALQRETAYAGELIDHYAEILTLLLERELQTMHSPAERRRQQDFLKLWHHVRQDPSYPWSGRELARRMGVATAYLPGICRSFFGVTPMQKVAQIRMELAHHLLLATDLSLAQIAEQVGYRTEYAFSDAFKRVYGCRPGAFRRSGAV